MAAIPTIIHQSWKDENIPHDVYLPAWVNSWSEAHPSWTRMFWTDRDNEELVRRWYPQFYDFYMGLDQGIKKADFARFLYMHRFGGVYVDLDFVCLKNLSPLLADYDIVLGRLSPDNEYYQIPNAFLASRPGCEFWMRAAADSAKAPPAEQWVEALAGPFRLQWAYELYQPPNSIVYGGELIYGFDWAHFTGGRTFSPERKQLAEKIRGMTPSEMSCFFPHSYCLTFWVHNW
jgi:mannosyltransferase OCH1-like enzyme